MNRFRKTGLALLTGLLFMGMQSCEKDDDDMVQPSTTNTQSSTYNYEFNNGQVVSSAAYDGTHADNLTATMMVEEIDASNTRITVELTNTVSGEMYAIHAHDAADANTTPNGTPYSETPNSAVFTKMAAGNGGSVSVSQDVNMSYSEITTMYDGFLVVHDPLQNISTVNINTYLVVGAFARSQAVSGLSSTNFMYDFNTGQLNSAYAYSGTHMNNLKADLKLQELANGETRVTVMLENTVNNETYMVHAHDQADPSTTPNNTPYNESPNGNVCTVMVSGNGGVAMSNQISTLSYTNLTTMYDGFFVVHDPLQAINTADPTTYVVLGLFARN